MNARTSLMVLALAVVAAGGGALWYLQRQAPPPAPPPVASAPPAAAPAPAAQSAPIPEPPAPAQPLAAGDVAGAVGEFVGRGPGASLVLTDDFVHRLVATVDNLGREHAPPMLWPVARTGGRFTVEPAAGGSVIATANAARYAPFVALVERIDMRQAAQLYWRMYPLLQAAYRELGFPKGSFNERLVRVIDLLLATPQPAQPVAVQLVDVKGSVPSTRPWLRYEFVDSQLQSLAAGQKILVRVGPDNERRLKAKLRELRSALASPAS